MWSLKQIINSALPNDKWYKKIYHYQKNKKICIAANNC